MIKNCSHINQDLRFNANSGITIHLKNIVSVFLISLFLPSFLYALPQDQEVFLDFEDAEGSVDFSLGDPPNDIRFIGFTVETLEDPNLLHSGTKAITLGPGEEGKIFTDKGIFEIEFYVAESTGAGRIEVRGTFDEPGRSPEHNEFFLVNPQGVVNGLPTSINPDSNPVPQEFIAFSQSFLDTSDLNLFDGMREIKFVNVTGKLVIDDVGYTLIDGPTNNTVFITFDEFKEGFQDNAAGVSPNTATFTDGFIFIAGEEPTFFQLRSFQKHWKVLNGETGTITFETPAAKVNFFAGSLQASSGGENDGTIQAFDTEDNLIFTNNELPPNIRPATLAPQYKLVASELGAVGGIKRITLSDDANINASFSSVAIDDFGFTPIGAPGFDGGGGPPPATGPSITTQPASQEVQSGTAVVLTVAASGDDLTYQWYTGNSGDTTNPVTGATSGTLTIGALTVSTNYWAHITNAGGSADSDTAVITVAAPSVPLVLDGSGDIAGENIQHANGNIFDQILLTGEFVQLQAKPGQITRVSFMDENEDIVQVEFSGNGTFTVTLDPATFLSPAIPPRYNQAVEYVTGKPSVVIDGADANTFFSIFTVGRINAFNQALFPEGQVYDAQADITLVEVVNSTGLGGVQLSNTVFSGSTGRVGVDARGVPIAVRLTVGDIDADGDAVPHLLFGEGSFTVAAGNPGLRITGGDLLQTNGASIVVAESGSTTAGFDTLITQNNFKSDNTPQPTLSIDATFANEDGDAITVAIEELTIE